MTVGELIAQLSALPLDRDVVFSYDQGLQDDFEIKMIETGRSLHGGSKEECGYNVDIHANSDLRNDPAVRTVTRIMTW